MILLNLVGKRCAASLAGKKPELQEQKKRTAPYGVSPCRSVLVRMHLYYTFWYAAHLGSFLKTKSQYFCS